jgi:hypothetical protein
MILMVVGVHDPGNRLSGNPSEGLQNLGHISLALRIDEDYSVVRDDGADITFVAGGLKVIKMRGELHEARKRGGSNE